MTRTIRREYHWVPWPQYVESRIAVLIGVSESTAHLRDRAVRAIGFETQARLNIAHAIAKLEQA